jgi:hypothetical protein
MVPRSENPDLRPTDEDLSVGTPAWGTRRTSVFLMTNVKRSVIVYA